MNDMFEVPYKNVEDLIERLEKIKNDGSGVISLPKSLYILAIEIQNIKNELS